MAARLLSVAVACWAVPAAAELDLALWRQGESHLKPTLQLDVGLFQEANAWFGESRENAGDHVGFWAELGVMPGLEGALDLGKAGTLRARVSGVWTTTQLGLDAAGSNFDHRHASELTLEDAYIGWSSGDLFPGLGEDAIDLSVGAQRYQVGTGFLFLDGATDGGSERGGYWIAMRKAFELTAIARLRTGPFLGEVVYLRPNDEPDTDTEITGVNLELVFGERATLGAGYWSFLASESLRRDGLDVANLRAEVHPFARLPGLVLAGELVYEDNDELNESWGGYAEIGHAFASAPGEPCVSYRFAAFTGNRFGSGTIEAFDPLYYGFAEWQTWYVGEIFGEYIGSNRNLEAHTVRLRAQPHEAWTVQLWWHYFRLDELATDLQSRLLELAPRIVAIEDEELGHELDVTVDWEMNEHVLWSAVAGALIPGRGLEQATGGSTVWAHFMLYASVSF